MTLVGNGAIPRLVVVVLLVVSTVAAGAGGVVAADAEGDETLYVGPDSGSFDSIQAAVAAADPGDRIVVREGTYTEWVTVKKPLTIVGEGEAVLRGRDDSGPAIDVRNTRNVTVRNLTIASYRIGVRVVDSRRVTLSNVSYHGDGQAVAFRNVLSLHVTRSVITGSDVNGIGGKSARNLTVTDTHVEGSARDGLLVKGVETLRVRGNTFVDNGAESIDVANGSDVSIRDNEISAFDVGIELVDVDRVVVTNNDLADGRRSGIYGESLVDVLATGNRIRDAGGNGVAIVGSRELRVTDNVVVEPGYDGVILVDSRSAAVMNDTVRNGSRDGLDFQNSSVLVVSDNRLRANGGDGIEVSGVTDADLTDNVVVESGDAGVRIHNGSTQVILTGSRVIRSDRYGLAVLQPPEEVYVHDNLFRNARNTHLVEAGKHDWDPTDGSFTTFQTANTLESVAESGGGPGTTTATGSTATTATTTRGSTGTTASTKTTTDQSGVGVPGDGESRSSPVTEALTWVVLALNAALAVGMIAAGVRQYVSVRPLSARFVGAMVGLLLVSATVGAAVVLAPARTVGENRPWALGGAAWVTLLAGFLTYRLSVIDRDDDGPGTQADVESNEQVGRGSVLDEMDDAILVVDQHGVVVDYNEACRERFPDVETSVSVQAAVGDWIDVQFPGDDEDTSTNRATLDTEDEDHHFLVQVTALSGDVDDEAVEAATATGEDRIGHVIRLTEVTDLEQRREELERKNEQLDQFASTVSHDLRNPMNVADGYADILKSNIESGEMDAETMETYVDKIDGALDRMNTIIDDSLMLAREGEVVDETETVRFSGVVREAWENVDTRRASLQIDGDGAIQADEDRLLRLLENLFRNAIDHVGPDVAMTVGIREWGFWVADDGPGIPEKHREGVFDYGYTTSDDGVGIGLAIVRTIGDAHGWTVDVDSDWDGACFVFGDVDVTTVDPSTESAGGAGDVPKTADTGGGATESGDAGGGATGSDDAADGSTGTDTAADFAWGPDATEQDD